MLHLINQYDPLYSKRFAVFLPDLTGLKELWLYHTAAKIEAPDLAFLCENLWALHIKFTDIKEIPLWIYSLKTLEELHLTGNLSAENNCYIVIDGLRELKRLNVLWLKSNLSKLPQVQLQKLSINNENLQNLTVTVNRIKALPPELSQCLKLWALHLDNNVLQSLPSTVGELTNLIQIELRGNGLECLPMELASAHCPKEVAWCCKRTCSAHCHPRRRNDSGELTRSRPEHSLEEQQGTSAHP
ncbi:volume-regulated anion channel subunit LRRC8A [Sigmodon hispidus]